MVYFIFVLSVSSGTASNCSFSAISDSFVVKVIFSRFFLKSLLYCLPSATHIGIEYSFPAFKSDNEIVTVHSLGSDAGLIEPGVEIISFTLPEMSSYFVPAYKYAKEDSKLPFVYSPA